MENETLVEYVICVKDASDLESLYEDLETPGGTETIPDRKIECLDRRPISRNTHYMLTDEESVLISNDLRVAFAEKIPPREYMTRVLAYTDSSNNWDKSSSTESNDKNWGLLRCVEGIQRVGWGTDSSPNVTGDVTLTSSGKGVDVVIVDGHVYADHPEFAVNPDGTGGTRVKQYNWYQHTPDVIGGQGQQAGNYEYPQNSWLGNGNDNHGTHVAGTVAGNSQGWARDADIYSITPYNYESVRDEYSEDTYTNAPGAYNNISSYTFDYLRLFHTTKTTNRPTIANNSWGAIYAIEISKIVSITYRGTIITKPTYGFSDNQLRSYGLIKIISPDVIIEFWNESKIVDITEAINAGVIIVTSAMNSSYKADIFGGQDYNNSITFTTATTGTNQYSQFYARGNWVSGAPGSICVGSISELSNDSKAFYSICGPRVDIYAPGTWIQSSVYNGVKSAESSQATSNDPRNNTYKLTKFQGTSMAAPQVTGVLACALENYPRMKPVDCLNYIINTAKVDQIADSGGSYTDYTSLQGSPNRYLFCKKERTTTGMVTAQLTNNVRKTSGMMFPRRRFI